MEDNLFDLTGKVAIVTGGTGVLGGAMAKGLAAAGAKVGILGRSRDSAEENVNDIEKTGGEAIPLMADVLVKKDLQAARDKVMDNWGRIDILVNAAGGNMAGATINPEDSFLDLEDEALENVMDLNFLGTYHPTKIFGEDMIKHKRGSIIHISSMAADRAITRVLGYSAAKAAVDNFTKFLATELAQKYGDGLRVNAIAPGFFIGEQNRDLLLNEDGSLTDRGQTIVDNTPMKRFGEKEELIGTAIWLASDASRFVTGTVIPVDGGFSAFSGV
ncbi:MAG: SDR family oxidoreductase [Balneolaceae bacterium]|nr:SDR family oxidoreductase [Balneolaceae bacterium]